MQKKPVTYKDAGVDISASDTAKKGIARKVRTTFSKRVLSEIGLFGGLFDISNTGLKHPVLVSSIDGVGTKLKVAVMMDIHNTVGQDIVAHCANDILVQGAKPLFFLDYIGFSRLSEQVTLEIIDGLVKGCKRAGCALLGGETAEMPGVYSDGDYDLVGLITGVVDKNAIIDGRKVKAGDIIIGLPSYGLHTNGYSLARKLFFEIAGYKPHNRIDELESTIGEELLKPHRDYSKTILGMLENNKVNAMAHITGGGFPGNIPRVLPKGLKAVIDKTAWMPSPVFQIMKAIGNVPDDDMYRTFNMGIGFILIVAKNQVEEIVNYLRHSRIKPAIIGHIEDMRKGKRERLVYSSL